MRTKIKDIFKGYFEHQDVCIKGWIRTVRLQKKYSFMEVSDGSSLQNIQVVMCSASIDPTPFTVGSAVVVRGTVVASTGTRQQWEIHAHHIDVLGLCSATEYPLQKKGHSLEFLRSIGHLRPRTTTIGAVTRVRDHLAYATHTFFHNQGFYYIHSPIITTADCEGAGELFKVCTEDPKELFFGDPAFLTVSGQLNAEIYACGMGDVYTFGPTFRAENSNTSRHLAEFWMIEPEMAFADLKDDIALAEKYLKSIFGSLLEACIEELEFFHQHFSVDVVSRLRHIVDHPFRVITYTEAINILEQANRPFVYPVAWGKDLQAEHERFLCETYFHSPLIVVDYPKELKAFYMRLQDDGKTVAAMDVLVPTVGEIIGGSQREERYELLRERMKALDMNLEKYGWYLDLRKYGSVPHAGFGAGFERLVQFATGMDNIRDVSAFPRYPGSASF